MDPFEYNDITPGSAEVPRPLSPAKRAVRRVLVVTLALVLFGTVPATVIVGLWVSWAWGITVLAVGALLVMLGGALGAVLDGTLRL